MYGEGTHADHPLHCDTLLGGLLDEEYFWRDHSKWLAESGYRLRPRYQEDWQPSWLKTKKEIFQCEDGLTPTVIAAIMDAVRVSDDRIVSIKKVSRTDHPHEEEILRSLTHEELLKDPTNHTVPLYEILQSPLDPDCFFIVMPYLTRIYTVKFATVGEAMECFRQLFEGLKFIHSRRVAHSDITLLNVMMDPVPLYSDLPHPVTYAYPLRNYSYERKVKKFTRTDHPTRYYYIDFGLSAKFNPGQETISPINIGGDRSLPEYENRPLGMYNPFKADIYTMGNLIREDFMNESRSLKFLAPLIADMTKRKPEDRPSIEEAYRRFEEIRTSLSSWTLRSRFVYRNEFFIARIFRACRHVVRTSIWIANKTPSLPTPPQ